MDYGERNYIDISPWMLVESSGDSESDFGMSTSCCAVRSNTNNNGNVSGEVVMMSSAAGAILAEDDAVSCSWGRDRNDKICKDFEDDDSCSGSSPHDDDHGDDDYDGGNKEDEKIELGTQYDSHCDYQDDDEEEEEEEEDEDGDAVDQVRKTCGGVKNRNGFRGWKGGRRRRRPEDPPSRGGVTMKQACCGRKQADQLMMISIQRDTDRLFWESCLSS